MNNKATPAIQGAKYEVDGQPPKSWRVAQHKQNYGARLRQYSQGGQHSPAPIRDTRNVVTCVICHHLALSSPCENCQRLEAQHTPAPAPIEPQTLDMGPLPGDEDGGEGDENPQSIAYELFPSRPPAMLEELSYPLLQRCLSKGTRHKTPEGDKTVAVVTLSQKDQFNLVGYLQRIGAVYDKHTCAWELFCFGFELMVFFPLYLRSSEATIITVLEPGDTPTPLQIAAPSSSLVVMGGAA